MSLQTESFASLSTAALSTAALSTAALSTAALSNSTLPNAVLVDRFRDRDEFAFAEIFQRHRQLVHQVCLRYLRHHHDAEDITQETFRRAALAMPRVDARRPLEPWLVTIAANRCRSFLARRRLDRAAVAFDESTLDHSHNNDRRSQSPPDIATQEQLEKALARLPQQQRRAFELVHRNQWTYPEVAAEMGCPTGTVKTWVRRAKQSMQHSLSAVAIASLCLLAWLGFVPPHSPSINPSELQSAVVATATPSLPAFAPESQASVVDWQWVSLDAFSRTRLTASEIEALPVAAWVSQSSPTLDYLRSGFTPLGSTLQRVAQLFQGNLASSSATPGVTPATLLDDPATDAPSAGTELPNEFSGAAMRTRAMLASLT